MKLAELLKKKMTILGIDVTTDDAKAFLTGTENIDVPDAIATKIDSGLFDINAAKSNETLTSFFRAQLLDPADARMAAAMTELGIEPDDDFKGTKSSYDKIAKLAKLAKAAGEKKDGAAKPGDATKWAEKEADYNRQLAEAKQALTARDTEWQGKLDGQAVGFAKQKLLFGKDYIFPKEMDMDAQISTAQTVVDNELNKLGFRMILDNGVTKIVNKENAPAYGADNVAIEPDTFITGVLTRNKLLKINDAGGGQQQQQQHNPGPGSNFVANPAIKGNPNVAAELDNQLKNMPN